MNFAQMIRAAEDKATSLQRRRNLAHAEAEDVRSKCATERRKATAEERAEMARALQLAGDLDVEIERAQAELAELRAEKAADDAADAQSRQIADSGVGSLSYDRVARVGGEARTYTRHAGERAVDEGGTSFFADMYRAEFRSDYAARDRLTRHAQEVVVEREMTARAIATGGLAGLVPPQYLVEQNALALRSGRPFANLIKKLPIPETGMSFLVPRGTTGASVGVQASENTAISNTDEVWANVTVNVATVAGYSAVSRQSLERGTPGVDQIIFSDMIGAYAAAVDAQCLSGTGTSGQTLGVLSTAGIGAATLFGAAPTSALFTSRLAGRIAAIAGAGATVKPRYIFMHPRRWGWWSTLVDTTGRPLVSTTGAGPNNANVINGMPGGYGGDGENSWDGANVVGFIQGLPVVTDINIPSAVGTNAEDQVIVLDTEAAMLFEDNNGAPQTLTFEQTASTSLQVTLVSYGYIAATFGRYPGANQTIGGLDTGGAGAWGLVAPTY